MVNIGEPIRGELHSTDADPAIEVPIYNQGSLTARTLAADEYIEVHSYSIVSAAGGDCYLFVGADNTVGTGEVVARGTVGTTGGVVKSIAEFTGRPGHKPWLFAPAGVVDVIFEGCIRKVGSTTYPSWLPDINAAQ